MMKTPHFFSRVLFALFSAALISIILGCGGSAMQTQPPPTEAPAGEVTQPVESPATEAPYTESPSSEVTQSPPTPTPAPFPTPTVSSSAPAQPTQSPVINESRRLTLEFPPKMRAGVESDLVRLTLEVDDLGNITPTARYEGHVTTGEVLHIPDLYETHYVTAEAQLDLAGMIVQPSGAVYEPLKRGQSATFQWSIRPQETGKYRGTIWLHLGFENRSTGEKDRVPISAQLIEIEAVDFFGFSVNFVRTSGVVGSVLGLIVGFPFLDDILKYFFSKKKKKK